VAVDRAVLLQQHAVLSAQQAELAQRMAELDAQLQATELSQAPAINP
jgi:hypothetical protein